MDKKQFEKYLNLALSTGADFVELYHEKRINKNYNLLDSKLRNKPVGIYLRVLIILEKSE